MENKICLISSKKYQYLKDLLLQHHPEYFVDLPLEQTQFPDGEQYYRIGRSAELKNRPAVYVCGTVDDAAVLEAYSISSTIIREQCTSLHLVIPYFGYSTMDRAVKDGEAVMAKNIANLLSAIPAAPLGNFVYVLDLHSFGTQYYFGSSVNPVHLTSWNLLKKMVTDLGSNFVLASPDMGRAKWVEKMGNELGLNTGYVLKKRLSGNATEVVALNADVAGKNVVIFDDMIRSGSSIINAAQAFKDVGARDIYVVTVHGIFVPGAIKRLKDSGLIKSISCTNSHPNTQNIHDEFIKVYDISELLLEGLTMSL